MLDMGTTFCFGSRRRGPGAAASGLVAALAAICLAIPPAGASVAVDAAPRLKPAAPDPVYLSLADHGRLELIINALKRKDFDLAKMTAGTIEDPIAKSLGAWLYYYAGDPEVSLAEADAFLDRRPDWPMVSRIQRGLEKKLDEDTPRDVVLALFDTRGPETGRGKLHFARALFAAGREDDAVRELRDAWRKNTFELSDENSLRARYGKYLHAEDHAARVDALLWRREVTNARRVIPLLPAGERRRAEARAALLLRAKNGPRLFEALNAEDRADPGVMHAAVRYYRRTDEEPRAVALARTAPIDPEALGDASRWWLERKMLLRWAIEEKRFGDAYAMAAGHGLEPSVEFSEAEFFAGWLALRFLDAPGRAETHFRALTATVTAPISRARGYYWLARAVEAQGEAGQARRYYESAAEHVYTFYGQLAAEKLGGAALARKFDRTPRPSPSDSTRFALRPTVAALRMLSELQDERAFLIFAYHVDDELETPGEYLELAELANARGAPHITVRAGKMAVRRQAFAPEVSYPLVFVPEEAARFAPVEVILGLSRQESEFNPRAYSRAGARGVMQLIPSTARLTARKEGMRYSRSALLDDPIYNMTVGSAHLSHLFERFGGSYVMTFAAYNAGAHRVSQWIDTYGDPRSPDVDPIDWAEMIPFSETRNYVQRVLENTQIYRGLFNDAPIPGRLSGDLERGGPSGRAGLLPARKYAANLPPLPARTARFASALDEPPASPAPGGGGEAVVGVGAAPRTGVAGWAAPTGTGASTRQTAKTPPAKPQPSEISAEQGVAKAASGAEPHGEGARHRLADAAAPSPGAPAKSRGPAPAPERQPVRKSRASREAPTPDAAAAPPANAQLRASDLNALQAGAMVDARDRPATSAGGVRPPAEVAAPAEVEPAGGSGEPEADNVRPDEEHCETYRNYIARTEKDEASAADLNAGMLAEITGDGPRCEDPPRR